MRLNVCFLALMSLIILGFILVYTEISQFITLKAVQNYASTYTALVHAHPIFSGLGFTTIYALSIMLGLPLVIPLGLLAGYLFGIPLGILYSITGAILGATGSFLVYRCCFSHWIETRYRTQLSPYIARVQKDGVSYLLMLQLLGIFPFFIITIVSVLAHVSVRTVAWITAIGSFPFILASVVAGRSLFTLSSMKDLFSPSIIMLIILCIALALAPLVIRYFKNHRYR